LPRVTRLQQMSRGNKHRYHMPDGPEQVERDAAMVANRERSPETMQWLFGFDAGDISAAL
jgi:salicylate hydroxylase